MPHYCSRYFALHKEKKGLFGRRLIDSGLILMIPAERITVNRTSYDRLDGVPLIFDVLTNETIAKFDGYYDGSQDMSNEKSIPTCLADDVQEKLLAALSRLGLRTKSRYAL